MGPQVAGDGRVQDPGRVAGPGGVHQLLFRLLVGFVVCGVSLVGAEAVFLDAFRIPTRSMEGTLLAGDFLLVSKARYLSGRTLEKFGVEVDVRQDRGDVVVFHPPHSPEKYYVKRVVGLPGDTVAMTRGFVSINGEFLNEPYVRSSGVPDGHHRSMNWQLEFRLGDGPKPTRDNWGALVVPEGHYFVLGDNRDNSEDSRYWGFVDGRQIVGEPWRVYYSEEPTPEVDQRLAHIRWDRIGDLVE